MEIDVDKRYQSLLVLWFAELMSVGGFFLFSRLVTPEVSYDPENRTIRLLIITLTVLAAFLVLISLFVKRRFLARSVDQQDAALVNKGQLFATAMCEVSALFGLLERLAFNYPLYYVLMLLAVFGMALHFPRREHLLAASFKATNKASF